MKSSAIKTISKPEVVNKARDFFGIYDITSKDIAGSFSKFVITTDETSKKYQPLMVKRNYAQNEESRHDLTYCSIRFDVDNEIKKHGQYDPDNSEQLYVTTDIVQLFPLDECAHLKSEEPDSPVMDKKPEGYNEPYLISEVQPQYSLKDVIKVFKEDVTYEKIEKYANKPPLYFEFHSPFIPATNRHKSKDGRDDDRNVGKLKGEHLDKDAIDSTILSLATQNDKKEKVLIYKPEEDKIPDHELDYDDEELDTDKLNELNFNEELDEKYDPDNEAYKAKPINALEHLKKIRSQQIEPTAKGLKHRIDLGLPGSFRPIEKLDSKGYINYSLQTPQWHRILRDDIRRYIKNSIVYNNYDILAVNKPYGLASYGDPDKLDINSFISDLASELRFEKAYLAHRLDKTTTGVLLFATSQARAAQLNKLFKSSEITKTYWCIVKGIPILPEAIIDIPIGVQKICSKSRMFPVPVDVGPHAQLVKRYQEARRAISEYHVLGSNKGASLVEVKPRTGVKHQIRCHLGFGLNRPILGDHKYSHPGKLAPQSLALETLNALHLRQEKVRTLPIYLHARSVVIPSAKANHDTLFIKAPLPAHFKRALKKLGLLLSLPDK